MDINKMLAGVPCACGKTHTCAIERVYIEKGAYARFGGLCADYDRILIVADDNTYGAAGEKVQAALSGKITEKVIFDGKTILIPDEKAAERVSEKLGGIQLIIGIGSGVIQDLCKYVSKLSGIPYMVAATAPSMDGYASSGAAMILGGMKETVSAGVPKAIVADTEVLKNAPMEMIKAGYGDIIGKFSALNDWKLSRAVTGEYFCQYIYDETFKMIEQTLKLAKGLLVRDEESVKVLMEALVTVGILMSFAGSSRPASGSEHHLSHFFEIVGIVTDTPYLPHGIDVAYSTVVTARIREKLRTAQIPAKQYEMSREAYEQKMAQVYKSVAPGCIALQDKVGNYANAGARMNVYREKQEEIRAILSEMPTEREILDMLSLAELDITEFYNLYGEEKINTAVAYAKDLKDRYTVLWINYDFFGADI